MVDKEELLAEAVRRFPVSYDRSYKKNNRSTAWDDVAKELDCPYGKKFFEKSF